METRDVTSPICIDNNKLTLDKKVNFSSFITIRPVGKRTLPSVRTQQMRISEQKRLTELDWHFDNIKTVLKCSNATPIRCKVGARYACSFCLDQFPHSADLKKHTLDTHENDRPYFLVNTKSLSRHIVYLDTTYLRCNICENNMDGLEELMEHLKNVHEETIHTQIKNQIVPFRFAESKMLCAVCSDEIHEFNDLQDHMSQHYKNYICEFCDASFVIRSKMLDHKKVIHRAATKKPKTSIIKIEPKKICLQKKRVLVIKPKTDKPNVRIRFKKYNEVNKHKENIRTILLSSNATPIRRYGGVGYTCCFCDNEYPEASQLKSHTISAHDDIAKSNFMKKQAMPNYIVKLDITYLRCEICQSNIESLEALTDHLTSVHDKPFHTDVKNHIVPFKFDNDLLHCVVCSNEFSNFKVLLEHMNVHYRNHVCEVCGRGFVNKRIFQTHMYRHKTGVFNCSYCSKVFDTRVKWKEHERAIHVCLSKRSKCGYCGEKFTDYTKKNEHEVKMHGARPVVLKCHACQKTFDNQRSLTVHTKTYHLMEKRLPKA